MLGKEKKQTISLKFNDKKRKGKILYLALMFVLCSNSSVFAQRLPDYYTEYLNDLIPNSWNVDNTSHTVNIDGDRKDYEV